ncbi:MAG TPA: hypothetical protein VMV20_05130 [Chitinophagaceae bacterium]|nr:hypothetical protein [Chitinophagaceae bacterium]
MKKVLFLAVAVLMAVAAFGAAPLQAGPGSVPPPYALFRNDHPVFRERPWFRHRRERRREQRERRRDFRHHRRNRRDRRERREY